MPRIPAYAKSGARRLQLSTYAEGDPDATRRDEVWTALILTDLDLDGPLVRVMRAFHDDLRLLHMLESSLADRAYTVTTPWREGPMSSGEMSFAGPLSEIRVLADRGQWFIEIRPAGGGTRWFNLEQWSGCLGEPASFSVTARSMKTKDAGEALAASWRLDPQVSWMERHLDDIERACLPHESPATFACLRRHGGRD